jgi:FdhE protein
MRQGEVASKGKWTGNPGGGVKAPVAVILPDLATKFARTAARLDVLAAGHPMSDWLRFMARLTAAQHAVTAAMGPLVVGMAQNVVEQAASAGLPPLAADGYRRDPAWRDALAMLLEACDGSAMPVQARVLTENLRNRGVDALEALADGFLHGTVEATDAGAALYVAAALQVWFTRLAACLPASSLRLLPQRGLCPCCGSTPVSGLVTETERTPGARYLFCSLCGTAWNYVRAACITCGLSRSVVLRGIEDDAGAARAETCDDCHTYAKMLYQSRDMNVDPYADDLATLGLDVLVAEAGWSRHAPNPMLLIG